MGKFKKVIIIGFCDRCEDAVTIQGPKQEYVGNILAVDAKFEYKDKQWLCLKCQEKRAAIVKEFNNNLAEFRGDKKNRGKL